MKKLLTLILLSLSITSFGKIDILLDSNNFLAIDRQFDQTLESQFSLHVMLADPNKEMLLYIDSPGGSVMALTRMLQVMDNSGIRFTCIARFAASAAFMLFQNCTKRLILKDGILMSHNASTSVAGDLPQIIGQLLAITNLLDGIDAIAARRMGLTLKEYQNLIANDLWLDKVLAERYNAIDGIVDSIRCTRELIEKGVTIKNPYGLDFFLSACPLISSPVLIKE